MQHTWEPEFLEVLFPEGGDELHDFFGGSPTFCLEVPARLRVICFGVVDLLGKVSKNANPIERVQWDSR